MLRQQAGEEMNWQDQLREPFDWGALARKILWVLLAITVLSYGVKLWRALAPVFAPAREIPRLGYRAALDRLAEIGLRRGFGESRERFAARAAHLVPAFSGLTEEHLRGALGSRQGGDPEQVSRLRRGLREEIRGRIPAWRRWIGLVNPFSWLGVR